MSKQSQTAKDKLLYWGKSLVLCVMITMLCLFLLAFLVYQWNVPDTVTKVGIILTYVLGNVCFGFRIGKKAEQRKFLWGLAAGTFYFILLLIISAFGKSPGLQDSGNAITTCMLCMGAGMLGGMLS